MAWKHVLHSLPSVRVDSLHKGSIMMYSLLFTWIRCWKRSGCRWWYMLWRSCDVTVINWYKLYSTRWGFTPLDEAIRFGHHDVARYLKDITRVRSNSWSSQEVPTSPSLERTQSAPIGDRKEIPVMRQLKKNEKHVKKEPQFVWNFRIGRRIRFLKYFYFGR